MLPTPLLILMAILISLAFGGAMYYFYFKDLDWCTFGGCPSPAPAPTPAPSPAPSPAPAPSPPSTDDDDDDISPPSGYAIQY